VLQRFVEQNNMPCHERFAHLLGLSTQLLRSTRVISEGFFYKPKFGSCGSENGASTQNHCGF
jgi:hypothetical protein